MNRIICQLFAFHRVAAAATLLLAGAARLAAAPASITINVHAGPGEPVLSDATGALLAAGAQVRVGWLDAGFDVAGQGWNPAAVGAAFHELGRTQVRAIFGESGRFAGGISAEAGEAAGRAITLWIVQTSGDALAGAYSNIVAHALVTSSAAHWRFPDPALLPPHNATTLAFGEATQVVLGAAVGGGTSGVQLARSGRGYSTWSATAFTAGETRTAAGDDPDGDGVSNLVEFFAGTSPQVANRPPVTVSVESQGGQQWLVLAIDQQPFVQGVAVEIQTSADLVAWSAVSDTATAGDAASTIQQRGRVAAPAAGSGERRYLRAVVRSVP
jgi:hypothetical protein